MYIVKYKNKQKEWHRATKPLKLARFEVISPCKKILTSFLSALFTSWQARSSPSQFKYWLMDEANKIKNDGRNLAFYRFIF